MKSQCCYNTVMSMHRPWTIAGAAFFLLAAVSDCSGPTDQDLVLDLMKSLGRYAEQKDAPQILSLIDADYSDFQGRSKDDTEAMLGEYFIRYRGIAANILRSQVEDISAGEAVVQSDIAFSSGAAKVFRKFTRISLDNYRLKLKLRKSGDRWLVTYAEWRPLGVGELLSGPE